MPSSRFRVATTVRADVDLCGSRLVNSDLDRGARYCGASQESVRVELQKSGVNAQLAGNHFNAFLEFRGGREGTAELVRLAR